MTPSTPTSRTLITAIFHLILTVPLPTIAIPCNGANPTANRLAAAIERSITDQSKHSWHVHATIPAAVSGLPSDERASFDAPFILAEPPSSLGTFLTAVFHARAGGEDNRMATYAAQTYTALGGVPSPQDDWTITAKLSPRGSMGHLFPTVGGGVFFAYESEGAGNTVAVRLYSDLATLRAGGAWRREVRLQRKIALPASPVTTDKFQVVNIGTPTITRVVEEDLGTVIHFRFHYYPEGGGGVRDLPGVGLIVFPPSGEDSTVVYDYEIWYGRFENKINNALVVAEVVGKIGQRAELGRDDRGGRPPKFLLLEGQMANAGEGPVGWLSWRPVLYELGCDNPVGALVPLTLPNNLQTLANPHITHVDSEYLLLSFFVPSEPFHAEFTSQYAGFDPDNCPTCAANPMKVATLPARSGTLLIIVEVDCVLGDDDAFEFKYKKKIRSCAWISKRKEDIRDKVCARKNKKCKGDTIGGCCKVACGSCSD